MYNFRFDSNKPPQAANATLGLLSRPERSITVAIQAPTPDTCNALQVVTAVSRKTHGGAGTFDIDLPLSGEPGVECRSGGANGNHTIVFTFSNNIVSGTPSITEGTGNIASSPIVDNTMTMNLINVADVQKITITLQNVTDSFAQVLPDTSVSMNVLMGDTTGNKGVSSTDITETKSQSGNRWGRNNFREDVVANGSINSADVGTVKSQLRNGFAIIDCGSMLIRSSC